VRAPRSHGQAREVPVDDKHSMGGVHDVGSIRSDWSLVVVVSVSCSSRSVLDDLGHDRHHVYWNIVGMLDHEDADAKQDT
jgi:hypothetical protein